LTPDQSVRGGFSLAQVTIDISRLLRGWFIVTICNKHNIAKLLCYNVLNSKQKGFIMLKYFIIYCVVLVLFLIANKRWGDRMKEFDGKIE
jgi:hypothetical protein